MNVFEKLQIVEKRNKIVRWVQKHLILNEHTKEFHFTEGQRDILADYEENERYYKMSRRSGKTTLLKCECLYYALKHACSVHIVFVNNRAQAGIVCSDYVDTLTTSGMTDELVQRNLYKITLKNRSEIYFVTPIGFEQLSSNIYMKNKKRFVYCDDITDVTNKLFYARTIQARFLAFSSLQQERNDT